MKGRSNADNVKISFIGIGVAIWKYSLSRELLDEMRKTALLFHLPLESAIWDADFFKYLNQRSNYKIENLYDLKQNDTNGLLDSSTMQIDIWLNTRRRYKIRNMQYENSLSLFPKYRIRKIENRFEQKHRHLITFSESYIGLIKTFKIETEKFDMDKLVFNLSEVAITEGNIYNVFTSISYDGKLIKNIGSDNLVTNRIALIHEGENS
jgi:hypothetical protein